MSLFDRPTLSELISRQYANLESRLTIQSGSLVRRSMARIIAIVWGGALHMAYGSIDWMANQLFVETASEDFLVPRGENIGITRNPATAASGNIDATGTPSTLIPDGTVWVRDDGTTYTQDGDQTTNGGGDATCAVVCDTAGSDGNMSENDVLTLQTPISGIDSEAGVDSDEITGGTDIEEIEDLRSRIVQRLRTVPRGGTDDDYEVWAKSVSGVTRAWVYPLEDGLGTVTVRFVRDDDVSIIPDSGEIADVQAAIDAEKPVTADVTVEAPAESATAFTISITPDTSALRTAVEAELAELFLRDAEAGDGAGRGTIYLSKMWTAVGNTDGLTDFDITVPSADVVPSLGDLPTLGVVTFT